MALFGVKEIVDPLAKEVREGYQDIRELLAQINECAHELVEATGETNRLLAKLVERSEAPVSTSIKPTADLRPATKNGKVSTQ